MNSVVLFQGPNGNHGGLLLADSTNSWSVGSYAKDLETWVPRLLAVWRRARKLPEGPQHNLLPREMQEVASGVQLKLQRGAITSVLPKGTLKSA